MLTFRDLVLAFRQLELDSTRPVIAHASLSAFGQVQGGAEAVLGALLASWETLVMPTFTYKTMIIPEVGPAENGLTYGSGRDRNSMAEIFRAEMPADRLMGVIPETLRRHKKGRRSRHPILSFSGVEAGPALQSQTIDQPLEPIRVLADSDGWVLLLAWTIP
jgi:aminoglycoside 3-N-acetyltransferase